MARSEARIFTSVWKDKDFRALPWSAQWLYFFLTSQPDMAHCGVIPLRPRRWASNAEDVTEAEIERTLRVLADASFIVLDEETGELLVRSLLRRDKVLRQPFLFGPASEGIENVESPAILAVLLTEIRRILAEGDVNEKVSEQVQSLVHTLGQRVQEWHSDTQSDRHPDTHPDTHGDSQSGSQSESPQGSHFDTQQGKGGSYGEVVKPSPIPGFPSVPPPAGSGKPPRPDAAAIETTAGTIIAEWIERCPKRPPGQVIGQIGKHIKAMLTEGIDPDDIRRGVALWMTRKIAANHLPGVVNDVMNAPAGRATSGHQTYQNPPDASVYHEDLKA